MRVTVFLILLGSSTSTAYAQCGSTPGTDMAAPTLVIGDLFGESVRTDAHRRAPRDRRRART